MDGTDAMDTMVVQGGDPCPSCKGEGVAEVMAVIPFLRDNGDVVLPHCYAICLPCHSDQYRRKYGYTPAEAALHAPPPGPRPLME